MKRYGDIVGGANALNEVVVKRLEDAKSHVKTLVGVSQDESKSDDERFDAVMRAIDLIRVSYSSALTVVEVFFPEFLISETVAANFKSVKVTVKSKQKAWYKQSQSLNVPIDENLVDNLKGLFDEVVYDLYYADAASEGVEILNTNLAKIKEEAGLKFNVKFAITPDNATVPYIDDDTIVIKANMEEAVNLFSYPLAYEEAESEEEEDSYAKLLFEEGKKAYIDVMQTIQTTPEILKKHIDFIEKLGNLKTRKLSYKLIREGYKKQAINLNPNKDEVGYYYNEENSVFALLTRNAEGFSYVLKPFDVKSNTLVDFDVISEVQKNAKQF